MKNNLVKLLVLSGIALCGVSAFAIHSVSPVDVIESTNDTMNNCVVKDVRNVQIGDATEVKVSKTFVQLGEKDDLLVLRFATAVSGPIKSAYYTRTCEGLGEKVFDITTLYQGIKSGSDVLYYDEVTGEPTTATEVQGDYYWACYVVAFETNEYVASNFNLELTVVAEDDSQVVAESRTQNLHNAIGYVDLNSTIAPRYNVEVESSDILPSEGGTSKLLTGLNNGSSRVYAGIGTKFGEITDLSNKKIELDVKPIDNVYKDRMSFELINGENKSSQEVIYFNEEFIVNGKYDGKTYNPDKYSVEIKEDGWYHVTLFVEKTWDLSSYETEYVNIGFANADVAKDATCVIANVNMSNYNLFENTIPDVEIPEESDLYDYSDDLQNSYGATVTLDTEVSHDGVKSAKFVGSDGSSSSETAGAQTHLNILMAGKKLSFYVKFDGSTCRKNRLATTVYSDSNNKLGVHNISLQDTLPNGITMSDADANGWHHIEMDFDTLGYNQVEIYKIRFVITSPDGGVTIPTCWIDQINVI